MSLIVRLLAIVGAVVLLGAAYLLLERRGFSARGGSSPIESSVARRLRLAAMPKVRQRPAGLTVADATEHWADHCAPCHAADGSGDTALGRGMTPPAPDMRDAATQVLSDAQIYWIIQNGVRFSGMPAWGEARDDDADTWALVDLIRTLPNMSPEAIAHIEHAMPVSEHERHERAAEDAFLRGEATAP